MFQKGIRYPEFAKSSGAVFWVLFEMRWNQTWCLHRQRSMSYQNSIEGRDLVCERLDCDSLWYIEGSRGEVLIEFITKEVKALTEKSDIEFKRHSDDVNKDRSARYQCCLV